MISATKKFFLMTLLLSLGFTFSATAKDECNVKFTAKNEGTMANNMGKVKTVIYHRNCEEWVEHQDSNVAGMKQSQKVIHKGGYIYTKNNGRVTKVADPTYKKMKELRNKGKSYEDVMRTLGTPTKEKRKYIESCNVWKMFDGIACYTNDWIPIYIENPMLTYKTVELKRGDPGPKSVYEIPKGTKIKNIPTTTSESGVEMPDINKIMKEAMEKKKPN